MHRLALVALVFSVAATACADPSAPTRPDPSVLAKANFARPVESSPVLDGVIRTGEYAGAAVVTLDALLPDGRHTPVTIRFTHDARYLYAVATVERMSPFHPTDLVVLEFDNDNDGRREDGDDIIGAGPVFAPGGPVFGMDFHRFNGGSGQRGDLNDGGTHESTMAWTVSTTNVGTFELRHDLNSADDAHDFSIDPSRKAQTVGVQFDVLFEADPVGSAVYTHNIYPSFTSYCQLTISKKATNIACP